MIEPSPTARAVLRGMMEPWIEELEKHIHVSIDSLARASDIAKNLWIHWDLESSEGRLLHTDVMAMELLELYARVDYREAWAMILRAASRSRHLEELTAAAEATGEKLYPRFAINGIEPAFLAGRLKDLFKKIVLRHEPMIDVTSYHRVRDALLLVWTDQHDGASFHRSREDRIAIKVSVEPTAFDDFDGDKVLASMRTLDNTEIAEKLLAEVLAMGAFSLDPKKLQQFPDWQITTRNGLPLPVSDVFQLEAVDLCFKYVYVTEGMLETVESMIDKAQGRVDSVQLTMASFRRDRLEPAAAVSFFRTLLLTGAPSRQPRFFDLLDEVRFAVFQCALSALQRSHTVREAIVFVREFDSIEDAEEDEVDVEDAPEELEETYPEVDADESGHSDGEDEDEDEDLDRGEDLRLYWAWVAYALFSREASHAIEHLHVRAFRLTQEHIRAFERVMRARDPLAFIPPSREGPYKLPTAAKASREPSVVDLAPRTKIYLAENHYDVTRTGDRVESLHVVDDLPNQVNVVYPGAGVCWVDRSDILARRTVTLPVAPVSAISCLTVQMDERTSVTALMRLFKLVGETLQSLTIESVYLSTLLFDDLPYILARCPHLRDLCLCNLYISDFDWIEAPGTALESLSLVSVAVHADGYQRFFAAQATTPSQLEDLQIQWWPEDFNRYMPGLLEMLDVNRSLERVLLSERTNDRSRKPVDKAHVHALQARHNVPLCVPQSRLSTRCKLAFVSAMLPSSDRSNSSRCLGNSALRELDAAVVGSIFAFAALPKRRVCQFVSNHEL